MPVAAVRALVRVDHNVVVLIELEDVFPVVVRRPGVALVAVAFQDHRRKIVMSMKKAP
jgi:hypothetical protein